MCVVVGMYGIVPEICLADMILVIFHKGKIC